MNFSRRLLSKETIVFFIFLCIQFFLRIISFRNFSLDPDELEWFYNVERCLINPAPYSGYDPHTTGPIAILILSALKLLTGFESLEGLRIVSFFFFIAPTFYILSKTVEKHAFFLLLITFTTISTISNFPYFGNYYDSIYCYNTEYQISVFLAAALYFQRKKTSKTALFLFVFLTAILPFIKFQSAPISAFLLLYQAIIFIKKKNYNYFRLLLIYGVISSAIILIPFIISSDLYDIFYQIYLRNVIHLSWDFLGQSSFEPANFFNRVYRFYPFILVVSLVFILWILTQLSKLKMGEIIEKAFNSRSVFSFVLLMIASLCIMLGKNDFGHYYILLFVPFSLFICDFFTSITQQMPDKKVVFLFIVSLIIFQFNTFYAERSFTFTTGKITKNDKASFQFGKKLDELCPPEVSEWLITHKNPKNNKIICLGWTQAQVLYYQLRNDYTYVYRSSHSFYLEKSFELNSPIAFEKESEMLKEDLKNGLPQYIVDTNDFTKNYPNMWVSQLIANKYKVQKIFKGYTIFELK